MDLYTVIVSIISALIVAAIMIIFIRKYVIELVQNEFKKNTLIRQESTNSKLVSLTYGLRNTSRDIINDFKLPDKLINNLNTKKNELLEALVDFRFDLDEETFKVLHTYKNYIINFIQLIDDLQYHYNHKEKEKEAETKKDLSEKYNEIEKAYYEIVSLLKSSQIQSN